MVSLSYNIKIDKVRKHQTFSITFREIDKEKATKATVTVIKSYLCSLRASAFCLV